jgi:hypothetical protein
VPAHGPAPPAAADPSRCRGGRSGEGGRGLGALHWAQTWWEAATKSVCRSSMWV